MSSELLPPFDPEEEQLALAASLASHEEDKQVAETLAKTRFEYPPDLAVKDMVRGVFFSRDRAHVAEMLGVLLKILSNIVENPGDPKYRRLKLRNRNIETYVAENPSAETFLCRRAGFTRESIRVDDGNNSATTGPQPFYVFGEGDDVSRLVDLRDALARTLEGLRNGNGGDYSVKVKVNLPLGLEMKGAFDKNVERVRDVREWIRRARTDPGGPAMWHLPPPELCLPVDVNRHFEDDENVNVLHMCTLALQPVAREGGVDLFGRDLVERTRREAMAAQAQRAEQSATKARAAMARKESEKRAIVERRTQTLGQFKEDRSDANERAKREITKR